MLKYKKEVFGLRARVILPHPNQILLLQYKKPDDGWNKMNKNPVLIGHLPSIFKRICVPNKKSANRLNAEIQTR